jgi:ABC-type methionine transport system ATPase subunit
MTIFDNVAFPLKERPSSENETRKVMYELEQVGLTDSRDKFPSQISADGEESIDCLPD